MLVEARPLVISFLAGALLVLIWSLRVFEFHDGVLTLLFQQGASTEERTFIRQAVEVEFPTPMDYAPIRRVCAGSQFRPGLLFTCRGQHGGIGMVRNQVLKCVRYAMRAGAAGLAVPTMALRNASDITDIETDVEVPIEHLMDRRAFVGRLSEACPGMTVYEREEDFPAYERRAREVEVVGDQFERSHPREGLRHVSEWRARFDEWLDGQGVRVRADRPVVVRMGQAFLEYPVREDGEEFVREFGKIVSFREDTRELAAKVLWELRRRFGLGIDPGRAISPDAFYGAHLRVEADALWAWPPNEWRFSGMEEQFEQQYQHIEQTGLGVVYVASGDRKGVEMFAAGLERRMAGKRNVSVATKQDLLTGEDRRKLDSLTFDQQALVDFLVLFKASAFMGVAHSSFPWNIALRRHEMSRYRAYANEGSDLLRDEFSVIMGMQKDYPHVDPFVYGLWP